MGRISDPRPLRSDDNIDEFDCGSEILNGWLSSRALRNQMTGASRTSVACEEATGRIAGFFSIAAGQIERQYLPKSAQRNQPNPLPVILLGQLAVDLDFRRRGIGRMLILNSLEKAVQLSNEMGCIGVLTQPIDQAARDFYKAFDFHDLPFDPIRRMVVRIVDLRMAGIGPPG